MTDVYWLVDRRVLLLSLTDESLTDEAWRAHFEHTRDLLATGHAPVYMIVDASRQSSFMSPSAARRFTQGGSPRQAADDGLEWTVLISRNMFVRFVASLLTQWLGGRMRAVDSLEEAVAFLAERDDTIPISASRLVASSAAD